MAEVLIRRSRSASLAVGVVVAVAWLTCASGSALAQYGPSTAPTVTTTSGDTPPGAAATVTFGGFCPGEVITVSVDGVAVGTVSVGPSGTAIFVIPGSALPKGVAGHAISGVVLAPSSPGCGERAESVPPVGSSAVPSGSNPEATPSSVASAPPGQLPVTGASPFPFVRSALLAAVFGLLLAVLARRRSAPR